jgi:hypothetical protein
VRPRSSSSLLPLPASLDETLSPCSTAMNRLLFHLVLFGAAHPLRLRSTISNSSSGNSQEMDSAEVSTAVNEPLDLVKLSLSE